MKVYAIGISTKRSLMMLLCATASLCGWAKGQIIVIANLNVNTRSVSKEMLHELFTGVSTSLHGTSVLKLVLQKQGSTQDEFLKQYIGKSDAAFRASWRSLVFSGEAVMPRTLDPEIAVVDYVAHTPGAIGYVDKRTPHEGVRVLQIE